MARIEKTIWLDHGDIEDLLVDGEIEPEEYLSIRLDRDAIRFLKESEELRDKEAMEKARKEVPRERNT